MSAPVFTWAMNIGSCARRTRVKAVERTLPEEPAVAEVAWFVQVVLLSLALVWVPVLVVEETPTEV